MKQVKKHTVEPPKKFYRVMQVYLWVCPECGEHNRDSADTGGEPVSCARCHQGSYTYDQLMQLPGSSHHDSQYDPYPVLTGLDEFPVGRQWRKR